MAGSAASATARAALPGGALMKPGQRYPTPSPGAGDRVFYESMLAERTGSGLAIIWCIEHGVFPVDSEEFKKNYDRYLVLKKGKPAGAPAAASSTPSRGKA